MGFYAIWPVFACTAALLALASLPLFAAADVPPTNRPGRVLPLDGLRGFLALAVFFHHAAIYHAFLHDGRWALPPARFAAALGPAGVSFFFMITGFLFWSQLVHARGRPPWVRLYVGRAFRIGPLYLVAVGAMLAVVLAETRHLRVPLATLAAQLGAWLSLGTVLGGDVNGHPLTASLLAGVTWSLQYEWIFYASLPLAALAARGARAHLPFALCGFGGCLAWAAWFGPPPPGQAPYAVFAALFFAGMACASLQAKGGMPRLGDRTASVAVAALAATVLALRPGGYGGYTAVAVALEAPAFLLVASGCTVFGLLTSRPARRLGDVSYGIYLLQGLALAAALRPGPLRAAALASPAGHWALVMLAAILLVAAATAAHAWIERPGIALGRRLSDRLGRAARNLRARMRLNTDDGVPRR